MRRPLVPLLISSVALAAGTDQICMEGLLSDGTRGISCAAGFPIQLFEPALGSDRLFTVAGPGVLGHMNFDAGVMLGYQRQPLSLFDSTQNALQNNAGADPLPLVENQTTLDISGALGLFGRAQVGVGVPIVLAQNGDYFDRTDGLGASKAGVGDVRIDGKFVMLDNGHGFGLSFAPVITAPTGGGRSDQGSYRGDKNATVRPRVAVGYRFDPVEVVGNVGYLLRFDDATFIGPNAEGDTITVGDQILWGAGGGVKFGPRVQLIGEFSGRNAAAHPTDLTLAPAEFDVGARIQPSPRKWPGGMVTLGGGPGLHKGIGSPVVRGFLAINWTPDFVDTDGDGIYDQNDLCPDRAEDRDGFEDDDGCPDVDNDHDLIPDVADKCPNEPEDRDTFEDEDGCPDPDNDKDGVPDIEDACPFAPGPKEFKGCTADTYDSDNDGVKDAQDKCPTEAEDLDGFQDDDGCPDPDNDKDGVPDAYDNCPNDPEDMDGFEDDDGCPDPDNDHDGVMDAQDKCPTEPETINGVNDEDGCPDQGSSKVVLTPTKIEILDKVFFKTGSADIKPESFDLLNQVALTLLANPQVGNVRVEGHTDNRGKREGNLDLSQRRAESVRAYLVKRGVPDKRLEAQGFGPDRPVVSNRTGKGRETNRRVEFIVVGAPAEQPQQEPPPQQ
jgi:outer membrane protein OmpA-like peptidoglycan-associated protein